MTPYRQTVQHNPEAGQYGDCTRTVIASLLDLSPEQVPHFLEDGANSQVYEQRIADFLEEQGYFLVKFAFEMEPKDLLTVMEATNPTLYWLASVGSPRADHHIVCRGGQVVSDPAGYDISQYSRTSDNYVWVEMLLPLKMQAKKLTESNPHDC